MISKRTKDALKAKKGRGEKLGTPANMTDAVRLKGLQARLRNAKEHLGTRQAAALIVSRKAQQVSYNQIAAELNNLGFTARRGGTFNQKQVQRLHERVIREVDELADGL